MSATTNPTTSGCPIRILIVEDHELLAQSLAMALRAEGYAVDVATPSDGDRLPTFVQDHAADVILLDLDLGPGVGDGATFVRPMTERGSRVLVVSGVTERARLAAAVEAGAVGLISKAQPIEELLDAVRAIASGEPLLAENDRQEMLAELRRRRHADQEQRRPFEHLTHREQDVLTALAHGMSVEDMAREWCLSEGTVRCQVHAVLTKLGARSQLAAVVKARQAGWLGAAEAAPSVGSAVHQY